VFDLVSFPIHVTLVVTGQMFDTVKPGFSIIPFGHIAVEFFEQSVARVIEIAIYGQFKEL